MKNEKTFTTENEAYEYQKELIDKGYTLFEIYVSSYWRKDNTFEWCVFCF